MEEKKDICPHCGGTETALAWDARRTSTLVRREKVFFDIDAQEVHHVVCLNCGTIIRSYITRPQDWRN